MNDVSIRSPDTDGNGGVNVVIGGLNEGKAASRASDTNSNFVNYLMYIESCMNYI